MKTALITGANRGIGKEIARQMAASGFYVIATGRNLEKTQAAVAGMDGKVVVHACDITSREDCIRMRDALNGEVEQLDVLVNNAGIMGNSAALDFDMAQLESVMKTNLLGAINITGVFWPLLLKSADARIINISSGMAETADMQLGHYAPYRLSKWALNGWTMLMAAEAPANVSINAMCPGWVRTDMGGISAPRPVAKGAETALWLATSPAIPSGKFFRDKKVISW